MRLTGMRNSACQIRSGPKAGPPYAQTRITCSITAAGTATIVRPQQLTQFQIEDNFTWVKGRHTLKFGFKGRQEYNNVVELQQAQGSDSFYGDWTAQYDPVGEQAASVYRLRAGEP